MFEVVVTAAAGKVAICAHVTLVVSRVTASAGFVTRVELF